MYCIIVQKSGSRRNNPLAVFLYWSDLVYKKIMCLEQAMM